MYEPTRAAWRARHRVGQLIDYRERMYEQRKHIAAVASISLAKSYGEFFERARRVMSYLCAQLLYADEQGADGAERPWLKELTFQVVMCIVLQKLMIQTKPLADAGAQFKVPPQVKYVLRKRPNSDSDSDTDDDADDGNWVFRVGIPAFENYHHLAAMTATSFNELFQLRTRVRELDTALADISLNLFSSYGPIFF